MPIMLTHWTIYFVCFLFLVFCSCWIQNDTVFYISVVAYFCLMFLTELAMFITILLQIRAMKIQGRADSWNHSFLHDMKRVASLTFLLGLTWGFSFFAWGSVRIFFLYLFAICNCLQGTCGVNTDDANAVSRFACACFSYTMYTASVWA